MTGIKPSADDVTDTSNEFFDTPDFPSEPRLFLTQIPNSLDCCASLAEPARLTTVEICAVGYERGNGTL